MLTISPFLDEDVGRYRVKVSNAFGTSRSLEAVVTIVAAEAGQPVIQRIQPGPDGFTITWAAVPYREYVVESNSDLNNPAGWSDQSDVIKPTTSIGTYVDDAIEGIVQKFYRIRLVPAE